MAIASKRRVMAFCTGCGNEVADPAHCGICASGRGPRKGRRAPDEPEAGPQPASLVCKCPRCNDPLDEQDIEGVATLMCPSCQGMFFPRQGLEIVLNKLRATCEATDMDSALQEFKDRFRRELPDSVQYKQCPVCDEPMIRRNYGTVSGVIVDVCYSDGTWVDGVAFGELADFIVRVGDLVADKASATRARLSHRPATGGTHPKSTFGRLMGSE